MLYLRGHLARPLDAALSAASRLAVLRPLRGEKEGLSGRRSARRAGINPQSALLALRDLERQGLVERREAGRAALWRLDRRRWVVVRLLEPLLERETELASEVAKAVKARLGGLGRGAFLFGAAAKGRLAPGGALGVAVVGGDRLRAQRALRALGAELGERFALEVDGRALDASAAVKLAAVEDAWRLLPDEGPGWSAGGDGGRKSA